MKPSKLLAALCLLAVACATRAEDDLQKRLTARIRSVLPDAKVTSVKPAPIAGLYEIMIGPSLLYMTEDGKFIVKGDIFDVAAKHNVTMSRRAQARVEGFKSLGPDSMIEFAPASGQAKRTLYVFTDIDCGYCRKLHKDIKTLTDAGIAVRYLAFPRTGLNSESYNKAVAVWCAPDRKQALTDAKNGKTVESKECPNPVKDHFRMGEAMGVHGTPAVYLDTGEELGGYIPPGEIVRMLNEGEI
ncbi:MAG: DsbC family protein [Gammaproteobacteria bacterium]|nr:DsbC family protein [Gammaproteobacteria bacterium]